MTLQKTSVSQIVTRQNAAILTPIKFAVHDVVSMKKAKINHFSVPGLLWNGTNDHTLMYQSLGHRYSVKLGHKFKCH